MADFPTSVVSLTNPQSTDTLASPSHSGQHSSVNNELEAVQQFLLDSWVDVRSYGATGDGLTDDTTAIQAAIDAADAGAIVRFPVGHYLFSSLTIDKGLSLVGAGWDSDNQGAYADASWLVSSNHSGTVLESTATSGAAITFDLEGAKFGGRDFLLIGPGANTVTGIKIGSGSNFSTRSRFDNVQVSNFTLGWDLHFVMDSTFIDCRSRGSKTGFSLHDAANQNVFTNIEVQFSDTDAILLGDATANLFDGGLLQNISGTSGVRLTAAGAILNTFASFYCEPTTTPTALLHVVLGSQNRFCDWLIGTASQTIRFEGGGQNIFENARANIGNSDLDIDGGSLLTCILFPSGFTVNDSGNKTMLLDLGAELFKFYGDIRIPTGKHLYFESVGTGNALSRDGGNGDTVLGSGSDAVRINTKTVKTVTYTTATRPTAASVGAGATGFNSTTGQPEWSTGTDWVDATGATV